MFLPFRPEGGVPPTGQGPPVARSSAVVTLACRRVFALRVSEGGRDARGWASSRGEVWSIVKLKIVIRDFKSVELGQSVS